MTRIDQRSVGIRFGSLLLVAILSTGCGTGDSSNSTETTLQQAVETLALHEQDIVEALRAKNPAAADEAMHDAMYYADHLSEFESTGQVDTEAVKQSAKQIRELLMAAHRGAHGNTDDWDPLVAADQLGEAMTKLKAAVSSR